MYFLEKKRAQLEETLEITELLSSCIIDRVSKAQRGKIRTEGQWQRYAENLVSWLLI